MTDKNRQKQKSTNSVASFLGRNPPVRSHTKCTCSFGFHPSFINTGPFINMGPQTGRQAILWTKADWTSQLPPYWALHWAVGRETNLGLGRKMLPSVKCHEALAAHSRWSQTCGGPFRSIPISVARTISWASPRWICHRAWCLVSECS